jgi:hypothetical protein
MVRSPGSPRTIVVKRRGSKRHVAEGDDWDNPTPAGTPATRRATPMILTPTPPAAGTPRLGAQ